MPEISINPVLIPSSLDIVRDVLNPFGHKDGNLLSDQDLINYDFRTVFYDVFYSVKKQSLMAIGPPLLNFKNLLFPLNIFVNGKKQNYKINESFPRIVLIEIESSPTDLQFDITIDFNALFSVSFSLKKESRQIESALITIQKNNKLHWIEDWVDHYKKEFGVGHVFIYDNGSDNVKEILEKHPEVELIRWNFPYGTVKSHDNKFAQRGMLNHFLYRFSHMTMIYQFDIDELAFLNNSKRFKNKKIVKSNKQKSYYLKDVYISHLENLKENYSFYDFPNAIPSSKQLRYFKKNWPFVFHHKYICNSEHTIHMEVHYFTLNTSLWQKKLLNYCLAGMKKVPHYESLFCLLGFFFSGGRIVFTRYKQGFISHFLGITTNWRAEDWNRLERKFL